MNIENLSEMNRFVEERQLYRMAKVYDCLEMKQGSQNLYATQTKSCAHNQQMTAIGHLSDTEEIIESSCAMIQCDGVAPF